MTDRAAFLAALDILAGKVAAIAPGARVGLSASAIDSDWCVYFNGPPLFLGHTVADLAAAEDFFAEVAPTGIRAVLHGGPYVFTDGARVKPVPRAGGPVADA